MSWVFPPPEFDGDWVTARADCEFGPFFAALKSVLDADVKAVNELDRSSLKFEVLQNDPENMVVSRTQNLGGFIESEAVAFRRERETVTVERRSRNGQQVLFSGVPMLDDDGRCVFQVKDGEKLNLWQVSRKALEDLFF